MAISMQDHENRIKALEEADSGRVGGVLWQKGSFQPAISGGPYSPDWNYYKLEDLGANVVKNASFMYMSWRDINGTTKTELIPVFQFYETNLELSRVNYNINGAKTDGLGISIKSNALYIMHAWMYSKWTINFMKLG